MYLPELFRFLGTTMQIILSLIKTSQHRMIHCICLFLLHQSVMTLKLPFLLKLSQNQMTKKRPNDNVQTMLLGIPVHFKVIKWDKSRQTANEMERKAALVKWSTWRSFERQTERNGEEGAEGGHEVAGIRHLIIAAFHHLLPNWKLWQMCGVFLALTLQCPALVRCDPVAESSRCNQPCFIDSRRAGFPSVDPTLS